VAHFQEPERLVPDKDSSTRTVSLWGNAICPSTFLTEKQKDTAVFNSKLLKKRKRENQLQDQLKDDRSAGMVNKIGPFGLWRLFLFTINK
jgi:hypothetical protein